MTSANNVHRTAAAPNPQRSSGGERPSGSNFIRDIIVRDLDSNKFSGHVVAVCANQKPVAHAKRHLPSFCSPLVEKRGHSDLSDRVAQHPCDRGGIPAKLKEYLCQHSSS